MRNWVSKTIVAGVTALAVGAATVAATEQASAGGFTYRGGGYGGWHGGFVRPGWGGGWARPGWGWGRPGWGAVGWGWGPGWGGCWGGGWNCGWGPAVAAGVIAGGALAVAAANSAPYYGDPCFQRRPIYSANGVWIGNGWVNVCQ